MRTTVNLEDDVLLAVRERARREKKSAGEVLSSLARQALVDQGAPPTGSGQEHHGFHPLPSRGAVVSNALIDRLREDEPE